MAVDRFAGMTDEQLVEKAHGGDTAAVDTLMEKYKYFVRGKARGYYLVGADHEDIVQEGMIGLYKAVCSFRAERGQAFLPFADMCVTRQMYSAIKMATRQKHQPLNNYISLNKPVYDDDETPGPTLMDKPSTELLQTGSPEEKLIVEEEMHDLVTMIENELTGLEKQVLKLYLEGCSYQEISQRIGRSAKCIDNALQRVKHKIQRCLEAKDV